MILSGIFQKERINTMASRGCLIFLAILGALLVILGGILIPVGNKVIYDSVKKDAVLTPDSFAYDAWMEPPIPVYMAYWVWHLKNPDQFLAGQKPVLEQKGPYTYKEYRKKLDVVHNPNFTITYKPQSTYVFDREMSVGPETDTFTTINMVAFTLASFIRYGGSNLQSVVELIHELAKADVVLELTVKDILWGYEDAYLKMFQDALGEGTIPFTEFGLFYGSNASAEETWTVFDGVNDLSLVNTVNVFNGMESLPWWSTEYANMINGTDGAQFHPYIQEDEYLYAFVPDICRAGYMLFDKTIKLKGIPVGEWYIPKELYANPSEVPDNIGFCTPDKYSCPPTGLINVTECYAGAPIFFSSPHFLYGENLLDTVEGLTPVEEEHKVYFALEMLTGAPFEIQNRLQVNIRIDPYDFLPKSENIQGLYMPILWLNQSTVMDDENADAFMHDVVMPQRLLYSFTYIFFGIGGGLFFGSIIALIKSKPKKTKVDEEFLKDSAKHSGAKVVDDDPQGLYEPGM